MPRHPDPDAAVPARGRRSSPGTLLPALLAALLLALVGACTTAGDPGPRSDGLATVAESALPKEARETLRLIDEGGPFPYGKDGAVFGNFEGELPDRSRGYYHEYTVRTPGERDRGARRIVTGQDEEYYYTDDHYASFKAVLR